MITPKIDTIAAIATPNGKSALGIIRLSGSDTFSILKKVFRMSGKREFPASFSVFHGNIVSFDDKRPLDQVLVTTWLNPRSFTGEDCAEISTHGNPIIMSAVLASLFRAGAREAEPGEFIRRAFLNGKVGLLEVEATAQILSAQSISQARIALEQLSGLPSEKVKNYRSILIEYLTQLEAALSFPEDSIEEIDFQKFEEDCVEVKNWLSKFIISARNGGMIAKGLPIVFMGCPNTGKSSLLNSIIGRERAIVTPHPGTTRDTIEEQFNIGPFPTRLIDTAGIRNPSDSIEAIGIERTNSALKDAFLIIGVIDSSRPLTNEDRKVIQSIKASQKLAILALNKSDFKFSLKKDDIEEMKDFKAIRISALSGEGTQNLLNLIEEVIREQGLGSLEELVYLGAQQISSLECALESLERLISGIRVIFHDMLAVELNDTIRHLGMVTGESFDPNMLDRIFEKFCIGK
ncbi:MAG: tRNA uridine-5-carboxymethylaminomethyl(34) synthesis GTPase MnmE [Candidatus Riflebacteria bacterium]|nr:tRNA uridine-5-carboxymethylaminomethyl(34) synthesis GTPase MnmE [Candidatus Riflebacteria bacterium]